MKCEPTCAVLTIYFSGLFAGRLWQNVVKCSQVWRSMDGMSQECCQNTDMRWTVWRHYVARWRESFVFAHLTSDANAKTNTPINVITVMVHSEILYRCLTSRPQGDRIKGTIRPKNYQIFKDFFLLLKKYQHVADVDMRFYSWVTYVNGV